MRVLVCVPVCVCLFVCDCAYMNVSVCAFVCVVVMKDIECSAGNSISAWVSEVPCRPGLPGIEEHA